jgi:methane/ammonia monooxygenase subunit B
LRLGGDYDFKIVLKARLPGRNHIQPYLNLRDAGAVMGPGQWIEVNGDPATFTNQVKTIDGDVIDMESYGLANGVSWHVLWMGLGTAWLLWWVRRPLFIPRYKLLQSGLGHTLIAPLDRIIGKAILVIVPLFVFGAYAMTESQYPHAIPLQAALDQTEPLTPLVNSGALQVKMRRTEYHAPSRSMTMVMQIHNRSGQPIRLGEFATANLRFINPAIDLPDTDHGDVLVAQRGLSIDSADPIPPGETRIVHVTAADVLWETEQLDGLLRDADSRLGGLLFFHDTTGNRYVSSVSSPVIPKFD